MLVVFFGLAVLIVCISVMTVFTTEKKKAAAPAPAPVQEAPVQVEEAYQENDDALIAVISAAIAAMWQADEGAAPQGGFVVRRIKRVNTAPAWQKGAREEQMYGRM